MEYIGFLLHSFEEIIGVWNAEKKRLYLLLRSTMGWEDENTPIENYLLREKVVHTPIVDT